MHSSSNMKIKCQKIDNAYEKYAKELIQNNQGKRAGINNPRFLNLIISYFVPFLFPSERKIKVTGIRK